MVHIPKNSFNFDSTPGYVKKAAKILGDYFLSIKNNPNFFDINMGVVFRGERKHIHIVVEEIPTKRCEECFFREMNECSGDKCSEVLPDTKKIKTICDQCLEDPKTCKVKTECEELRNHANK